MLIYETWLREKLDKLKYYSQQYKLTKHERRYVENIQWHISTLFDECDQLDIDYNIAVEQLHWGITRREVSPSVADGANTAFK